LTIESVPQAEKEKWWLKQPQNNTEGSLPFVMIRVLHESLGTDSCLAVSKEGRAVKQESVLNVETCNIDNRQQWFVFRKLI
jgi:hypothetical protein